jgi:HEPN domain-containing protein
VPVLITVQGIEDMSQMHDRPYKGGDEDLELLLVQGVSLERESPIADTRPTLSSLLEDEEEAEEVLPDTDVQGGIGLFAEAAQDMATASVELSLGRHFACVDYCNQVAEKAAQAVSLVRAGRRSRYDHDLRALGVLVGAPPEIQDEMEKLTPFHPEAFYAETPPEEADEVINAEQASYYIQSARRILRWARNVVLNA